MPAIAPERRAGARRGWRAGVIALVLWGRYRAEQKDREIRGRMHRSARDASVGLRGGETGHREFERRAAVDAPQHGRAEQILNIAKFERRAAFEHARNVGGYGARAVPVENDDVGPPSLVAVGPHDHRGAGRMLAAVAAGCIHAARLAPVRPVLAGAVERERSAAVVEIGLAAVIVPVARGLQID